MSFLSELEHAGAQAANSVANAATQAAETAATNVAHQAVQSVVAALTPELKAAASRLQTYLTATQANYAAVLASIRKLEQQEAAYEAAVSSIQQQLSALATEAGTDVATLVKSL